MSTTESATPAAAQLQARLNDPQVAGALNSLLDHADLLAVLVAGLDQFVARSEVIGDSLLAGIQELQGVASAATGASGQAGEAPPVNLPGVLNAGMTLAGALPKAAPAMASAIESGAFDKLMATAEVSAEALDQVEVFARALVKGTEDFARHPIEVKGPVTLVKLLRDPDVNTAISYVATLAKAIGRELNNPQSASKK